VRGPALDRRSSGFSLIELLVVMGVIGVLVAMLAQVATPGDASRAHTEARRLAALLELALAETRASGQSIAWSAEAGGYSFWRKDEEDTWVRFPGGSPYARRALPGATELREVTLNAQSLGPDERIVLTPYGLGGAIRATVSGGGASFVLRGGMLGRITVERQPHAVDDKRAAFTRLHAG